MKQIYILLSLSIFFIVGCQQEKKKAPANQVKKAKALAIKEWNSSIKGSFSTQTTTFFDSIELASFFKSYPDLTKYRPTIQAFYRGRKFDYAWFDKQGMIEQAGNLFDRMVNLNEGTYTPIPYLTPFDSLMAGERSLKTVKPNTNLELMLTAQYFAFANRAWQGVDDSVSKLSEWYVPRKKISYEAYLDSLIRKAPDKISAADEPVYRQYDLLRKYLQKYQLLDKAEKWDVLKSDKKAYQVGDSTQMIAKVKARLFKLGDFKSDTSDEKFTDTLAVALKDFQNRMALVENGKIDKNTLTELNVSPKTRLRQIIVNMERCRWVPVSVNSDYLAINIPEFALHVYHADSLYWSCNVVVGKALHETVIFSGDLKYIVFSPYWNIPPSIVKAEIIPGIRSNPNYISAHNMEITGYSGKLPNVRQKPGPKNSLGLVKFLFPNTYNIYLHDTPSKSLFAESTRAFSHGCIRVSQPEKLADFLLRTNPVWTPKTIGAAMRSGKEKTVVLKNKVPVFIAYFTSFVDRTGKLNFRKDIYNRDERLAKMIIK